MKKERNIELQTAQSLKKEYDYFNKLATRSDAPKIEQDYYASMLNSTASRIDWRQLEAKKKKEPKDDETYEYDK